MKSMEIEELYKIYIDHPIVCTDTRKVGAGDLFFALKGDRFNGNAFARQALNSGAAMAVVDEEAYYEPEQMILVDNVLETLQQLANYHRKQLEVPVIAITGSNGKTTTKELVAAVMNTHYETPFTQGNFNNHIGVPLTLLSFSNSITAAVVEMGANHQGEIDLLCQIAQPTHGLVTNIGAAHLEGFGGLEGVKKGKSELYHYLRRHSGVAFINKDEPSLLDRVSVAGQVVFYKSSTAPSLKETAKETKCIEIHPFIKIAFLNEKGNLLEVSTKLSGKHNFQNVMAAVAIGKYFKVPAEKIASALEEFEPHSNRSQWIDWRGLQVFMDAYNANPSSMKAALTSFVAQKKEPSKQVVILGDMLELGTESQAAHRELAHWAQKQTFDEILLVGEQFKKTAEKLDLPHFSDVTALKTHFDARDWPGAQVFIKGSRGIALEKLMA